eukprot:CAMPEP_0115041044 /NCGR_PEP_ID=MMETSP0216-20121206/45270_1 /TAXON_ID=223996 /ORGANISM="Protocruzia adherens, Strain Boccale" /LENGTH=383 /DNA_ID=CAMNT_0002422561 /DNA_START=601 /DNA_END=1752 /DNA_ORIENTATION=+
MKQEIASRGPIVCKICTKNTFYADYTSGIFGSDNTTCHQPDRYVTVIGWSKDETSKLDYWIIKESLGIQWGEGGFMRLQQGQRALGIETFGCDWAGVDVDIVDRVASVDWPFDVVDSEFGGDGISGDGVANRGFEGRDGVDFMTPVMNQDNVHFCASSWVIAVTGCLEDRLAIDGGYDFRRPAFSVQSIIHAEPGGSSCEGGDPTHLNELIYFGGLVDISCNPYRAANRIDSIYVSRNTCQSCDGPIPTSYPESDENCFAIETGPEYKIDAQNTFSLPSGDVEVMKSEIAQNGPIICKLMASDELYEYEFNDDIFEQEDPEDFRDQYVVVVGWGLEENTGRYYWIVRNSWGTIWGDHGYVYLYHEENNLGIERECIKTSAIPV